MSAEAERIVELGGPAFSAALTTLERELLLVAEGGGPVLGPLATSTIAAGGKRLRPLLVFITAGADALERPDVMRSAVAVELLHAATLVHDDLIDGAALRRGLPTVAATQGRLAATATGDFLFARAFVKLLESGRPQDIQVLSRASSALAEGEFLQREDAFDLEVSVERYLARCERKTARLFEAACQLGALAAGSDQVPLAIFGLQIGLAFQILDDVLDISGPSERTGKPRGTDLREGVVTLPLILARERSRELEIYPLRSVTAASEAEVDALCDQIAATGALDAARGRALEFVALAKQQLTPFDGTQQAMLELVADSVVERYA